MLVLTSVADRTSPVMRGKWVMEVMMGSPPPAPPPNVPTLEETKGEAAGKVLTVRERMEEHRKNPQCTSCHRVIDPLGLALENFDVTGKYRIKDAGMPVDPSGALYDGTPMSGPAGLRAALLKHQDAFLLSFTENLMTYALGRRIDAPRHVGGAPHHSRCRKEEPEDLGVRAGSGDQPAVHHGPRGRSVNDRSRAVGRTVVAGENL